MRRHVLIVEDNEDGGDALRALVEDWGYRVDLAPSGAKALEIVATLGPDTIILDMGLPDMSGCQLVRRLRNLGWSGLVIGYSAFSACEEAARRDGCDAYVLKPAIDPLRVLLD